MTGLFDEPFGAFAFRDGGGDGEGAGGGRIDVDAAFEFDVEFGAAGFGACVADEGSFSPGALAIEDDDAVAGLQA